MLAKNRKIFVAAIFVADIVVVAGSIIAAQRLRAHLPELAIQFPALILLAALAWAVCYANLGLYDLARPRRVAEWLINTALGSLMAVGGLYLLFLSAGALERVGGLLAPLGVMCAIFTAAARAGVQAWQMGDARKGAGLGRALVVGPEAVAEAVCCWINARPAWGIRAVALGAAEGELTEAPRCLREALREQAPEEIIFIGPPPPEMLAEAARAELKVRFLPDLSPLRLLRLRVEPLAGLPAFCMQEEALPAGPQAVKRALDIVLSAIFLACLAPLFIFVAVMIKIDSAGPVFFKQERIGQDGRRFAMYKFRSMKTEAARQPPTKVEGKGDPRVTRVGAWLRRLSIDELPQLFNVLRGEMSLVGPRPETPFYVRQYSEWNRLRLLVKPGMAGLAQANGVRGNTTIDEKTQHDLMYIETQSPAMDLALLAKTVLTLPLHRDAY